MAARRQQSRLPQGTTLADFSSPARILAALGNESAIRAEYSRQRSIIRKRVERMAAAGETANQFYQRFGNLGEALPTAKGMSTQQMMLRMAASARAISGSYTSTLGEVKENRREQSKRMAERAREAGDEETAAFFEKGGLSPRQEEKVNKVWGIVRAMMGSAIARGIGSGETENAIVSTVIQGGGRSVLSMATQVMTILNADLDQLEGAGKRFTQTGKTRVAWSKAHGRGRKR